MNTQERIIVAIQRFNDACDGQVNLNSAAAREDLAALVYDAVLKINGFQAGTYNDQQLEIFEKNDADEHK